MLTGSFHLVRLETISEIALKPLAILSVALIASAAFAQQTPEPAPSVPQATQQLPPDQGGTPNTLTSLSGAFFEHNFVNLYAFAEALHDSNAITLNSGREGSWGVRGGGGVDAYHEWRDSIFSINYQGAYTHYQNGGYESGANQRLSVIYTKRLGRRWTLSADASGGIFLYGNNAFFPVETGAGRVVSNPFSPENKFLSTGVSMSYQQTRRLSYEIAGRFFMDRYSTTVGYESTGVSGSASVNYRLSALNTLSGTYSHTYITYKQNAGQSTLDGTYLTLRHLFPRRWTGSITGGVTRADSSANDVLPVQFISNGQVITAYTILPYHRISWVPTFEGTATYDLRRSQIIRISGGQQVIPGNGIYQTSRTLFLSGIYSRTFRRANFSAGAGYDHLSSVSTTLSSKYSTANLSASYGYSLTRYIAANFRYSYLYYGTFSGLSGISDNRIAVGVSFSSKGIPMTLF